MPEPIRLVHPPEHPEQHEHKDISFCAVFNFAIVVILAAVAVHVGLYLLMAWYGREEQQIDRVYERSAITQPPPPPSIPLQGIPGLHANTPARDMQQLRAEQQQLLSTYGPTDTPGFVRIPIDRAMDLLVQQQFSPNQKGAPANAPR